MRPEIKLNRIINFQRRNLVYLGCWPQKHYPSWKKRLYAIWAAVAYIFILGLYIQIQTIDVFVNLGNVDKMIASLFLLLTNVVHSFKIFICINRSEEFDQMIDYGLKIKSETRTAEEIDVVKRYEKSNLRNYLIYVTMAALCVIPWALVPVFENKIKGENRSLPLSAWYPFDIKRSPAYELCYIHQVVAIAMASYSNTSLDSIMTNLMSLATCELELLMIKLKILAKDDETLPATSKNQLNVVQYSNEPLLEERLYKELCDCIIFHEEVYSITRRLQICISPAVFAQFSVSEIILCASLYQLAMQSGGDKSPMATLGAMMYLACMIFELFLYCRAGNELLIMSLKVGDAANQCNWYSCSKRFCGALQLLMVRALRPIRMTAGSFIDLSFETLMTIVKASYSFFTILQNSK